MNFAVGTSNWKEIVDNMSEGLMIIDPEGTICYVNKALRELLQYEYSELIGSSCKMLECSTCFKARRQGGGHFCILFDQGSIKKLRCAFRRKDGLLLHVYKSATVLKNAAGKVVAGVENLTDLSAALAREQEITTLRRQINLDGSFFGMIGSSAAMQKMYQLIESAALSEAQVIILGESGTGKELVANALFSLSKRNNGPFIKVNCAALNKSLLESELFGHVKGAFTGAELTRIGRFEAAHTGCIFLDEIADMPLDTQIKLLRVLQERELERVGANETVSIDVRVVAATNKNLEELMLQGRFREDLFYRISVIPIHVPPLRDRREDIPELVRGLFKRLQLKTSKPIDGIDGAAMELLLNYDWPGNVRELINVLEYGFVLCHAGEIEVQHLPHHFSHQSPTPVPYFGTPDSRTEERQQRIQQALQATDGNRTKAAALLGVSRVTLWKWMKKK